MGSAPSRIIVVVAKMTLLSLVLSSPGPGFESARAATNAGAGTADDLLVVDCALPGQIRQLGRATTYVAPRQPVRTTARDCRIRGGEYVVHDRATLATSLKVWLDQARAGDPEAQTIVGELFERGAGSEPDYRAAAQWYQRAADAGSSRAQVNLGQLYERGLGVPADPQTALEWYRRAAGLPAAIELETVPDVAPLLAARDAAIAELRRQVAELRREAEELRTAASRARLQLNELRAERRDRAQDHADQLEQRLQNTLSQLEAREQEIADQAREMAALEARAQTPAAATPALANRLLAGPDIALIEPELGASRGLVKVTVAARTAVQRVVGRVTAPAGVLSATVNAEPVSVNEAGVFVADIDPTSAAGEVVVTAIDQQGKRADLSFLLRSEASSDDGPDRTTDRTAPPQRLRLPGQDYALLIGNEAYRHLPRLHTPIADVERLERILGERYGFRVRTLHNATRYDTLSALNDLRERLTSEDRLLVYYAGHGELEPTNMRGHWLPVDAEPDSTANWLSNVDVTDILNVIRARQILLVADSCYSGTLTRSSLTRLQVGLTPEERATWLELMARKRARVVLTSGGLAPVLDFGGGEHSVFARSFIEALETNDDILLGRGLYQAVAARVAHAAAGFEFEQIPQYAPIAGAGHESGDFILQPLSGS
jgi:ABC-type phosphate transport system auxiliary subunit